MKAGSLFAGVDGEDEAVAQALALAREAHARLREEAARAESPLLLWERPLEVEVAQAALREALGRLGAAVLEAALRQERAPVAAVAAEAAAESAPVEELVVEEPGLSVEEPGVASAPAPQGEALEAAAAAVKVDSPRPSREQPLEPPLTAAARLEQLIQSTLGFEPALEGREQERTGFALLWWLVRELVEPEGEEQVAKAADLLVSDLFLGLAFSGMLELEQTERWAELLAALTRMMQEAKQTRKIRTFHRRLVAFARKEGLSPRGLDKALGPRGASWRADAEQHAFELFRVVRALVEVPATPEEAHQVLDAWSPATLSLRRALLPLMERGLEPDEALLLRLVPLVEELNDSALSPLREKVLRASLRKPSPLSAPQAAPVAVTPAQPKAPEVVEMAEWAVRFHHLMEHAEEREVGRLIAQVERETSLAVLSALGAQRLEMQRAWGELLAALVRHLEEREVKKPAGEARTRLMQWASRGELKNLYGLHKSHQPRRGSWREDALECGWSALRCWRAQLDAPLEPAAALSELEQALRAEVSAEKLQDKLLGLLSRGMRSTEEVQQRLCDRVDDLGGPLLEGLRREVMALCERGAREDAHSSTPGAEWEFWPLVEGRPAVMVGSAGKKTQLEMIERAFRFSKLEHVEAGDQLRRLQALAGSIKEGDERIFLVMHRHISHNGSDPIWERRADAVVIGVDRGFAVGAVRAGIEKDGRAWLEKIKAR